MVERSRRGGCVGIGGGEVSVCLSEPRVHDLGAQSFSSSCAGVWIRPGLEVSLLLSTSQMFDDQLSILHGERRPGEHVLSESIV